jgi:hypothetical protein
MPFPALPKNSERQEFGIPRDTKIFQREFKERCRRYVSKRREKKYVFGSFYKKNCAEKN